MAPQQVDVYAASFNKQDLYFADRALKSAVESFLDVPASDPDPAEASAPSSSSGSDDGGGGFFGGFSDGGFFGGGFTGTVSLPDTDDIVDGLPKYSEDHSAEQGIGLAARWDTGHRLQPLLRLETGQGESTYDLPDGAGILSDPIRITADTRYYHAEIGALHATPLTDWLSAEVEATIGARSVRNRLKVQSALLDVEDDYATTRGFAGVAARVTVAPPALQGIYLSLEARGRAYDRTTGAGQAGAAVGYRHRF